MAVTVAALALGLVGCSEDGGSEKAFCRQVKELPPLDSAISGFSDADPTELAKRLDATAASYAELRDAAPKEIRGSVGEVVDLVDAVIGAVQSHPNDPEAAADELRSAVAEHPDAPQASTRVVDYAADQCDVALNPTLDAPTDTTGGG